MWLFPRLLSLTVVLSRAPCGEAQDATAVLSGALKRQVAKQQEQAHSFVGAKLSEAVCNRLSEELEALDCTLAILDNPSKPDGCECKISSSSASCPSTRPGFRAVTPSTPFQVGDRTVLLCMYWQSQLGADSEATIKARKEEVGARAARSKQNVRHMLEAAWGNAAADARMMASGLWSVTPTPAPFLPRSTEELD